MSYKTIQTEVEQNIGIIYFNRPEVLNALSPQLRDELGAALLDFSSNDQIGAIVITGNGKAILDIVISSTNMK